MLALCSKNSSIKKTDNDVTKTVEDDAVLKFPINRNKYFMLILLNSFFAYKLCSSAIRTSF